MDGNIATSSMDPDPTTTTRRQQAARLVRDKRTRLVGGAIAILCVLLLLGSFLLDRSHYVSTSDARIAADMIAVSTDISGRITEIGVSQGDRISKGDVLFRIDDREAVLALAQFEAEAERLRAEIEREETRAGLASSKAGSEVAARAAGTQSASASVQSAQSDYDTAQRDFERTKDLFDRGRVARAALDQAQNTLDTAEQALLRAQAERQRAAAEQRTASITGQEVQLIDHQLAILRATLQQAEAKVDAQKVVVDQHTIRSPIDGVVDEVFYDVGEHSLRGFRMALLHNPDAVWVSANVKETSIRNVQIGAPVKVKVDSYPDLKVEGTVARIHDATLAEASLLPNPNANGVFTKITQRIGVRVDLKQSGVELRPGTMVQIRIEKQKPGEQATR